MAKSAPVMLLALLLARKRTRSATSAGSVKRPVTVWLAACLATSSGLEPVAWLTAWATPPAPSHADGNDCASSGGEHGGQRGAARSDGGHQVEVEGGDPVLVGDGQKATRPGRSAALPSPAIMRT